MNQKVCRKECTTAHTLEGFLSTLMDQVDAYGLK